MNEFCSSLLVKRGLAKILLETAESLPMPGVYSAPLLLAGSIWLVITARHSRQPGLVVLHSPPPTK
jgi:hypothetical protein